MTFIHIRNLEKYHPGYKDRELVWAKVYFGLVQGDPEFELIKSEVDKWRFVAMICLELRAKKPLPNDPRYWQKWFNIQKRPMSFTLKVLQPFIDICNESVTQSRVEENRGEEEKKKEKEEKLVVVEFPKAIDTEAVRTAWGMFLDHRKEIKKRLTPLASQMAVKRLLEYSGGVPNQAVAVIEQTIANGWQGLFPLKNGHTPKSEVRKKKADEYCQIHNIYHKEILCPKCFRRTDAS